MLILIMVRLFLASQIGAKINYINNIYYTQKGRDKNGFSRMEKF